MKRILVLPLAFAVTLWACSGDLGSPLNPEPDLTAATARGGKKPPKPDNNQPPNAVAAVVSATPHYVGSEVQFDGSGSTDDGNPRHLRYFWDFGDGSTSTSKNPSHVFAEARGHLVTLTVRDKQKATDSDAVAVLVEERDPPSGPVVLAAGDIARCNSSGDEATADLIATLPGTVLTLGDNVYDDGAPSEFAECYDPSWGNHKDRTMPSPGNHDYHTPGAAGYFDYFGAAAGDPDLGYYSFDIEDWHFVSLNSNVSMSAGSAQDQWLRADLAASDAQCTVAYWHHPRFSSGTHGNSTRSADAVQALYELGADIVLTGHDHHYERFVPTNPSGQAEVGGLVHFVVGTGGTGLRSVGSTKSITAAMIDDSWGVLKLTLGDGNYTYEFVAVNGGAILDGGTADCR